MSGVVLLILRFVLALALYAFVGWALLVVWRDLRHQQKTWTTRHITPLSLRIHLDDTSRIQQFLSAEITIGRDPDCECVIDSKTVSARHARLSFHQSQWWLEDLGSTNGTLLNQEPVGERAVLALGDQLQCGEAILTVEEYKAIV
jgi:pSer/pThr/pTyr-binding forkhead associated (FHA) protein